MLASIYDSSCCFRVASIVAQLVKNLPAMWETRVRSWVGKIPWRRKGYPLQYSSLENSTDCIWGRKKSDTAERLSLHFISLHVVLEEVIQHQGDKVFCFRSVSEWQN